MPHTITAQRTLSTCDVDVNTTTSYDTERVPRGSNAMCHRGYRPRLVVVSHLSAKPFLPTVSNASRADCRKQLLEPTQYLEF